MTSSIIIVQNRVLHVASLYVYPFTTSCHYLYSHPCHPTRAKIHSADIPDHKELSSPPSEKPLPSGKQLQQLSQPHLRSASGVAIVEGQSATPSQNLMWWVHMKAAPAYKTWSKSRLTPQLPTIQEWLLDKGLTGPQLNGQRCKKEPSRGREFLE